MRPDSAVGADRRGPPPTTAADHQQTTGHSTRAGNHLREGHAVQYVDSRDLRKERGAFFTPEPLAAFIAGWALRDPDDSVLEPSCGEAVFLRAAAARLRELGAVPTAGQLTGVDLHAASVDRARRRLGEAGLSARLAVADFFDYRAARPVRAVIGNPPYIRYQDFRGAARAGARRAALAQGVGLTALASSWAAFVVHAASFLAVGGRMGLVLPAELLSVNYAAPVREFLLRRFERVRLILFDERVFPGVQEEVVLLLADGHATGPGADHVEFARLRDLDDLSGPGGLIGAAGLRDLDEFRGAAGPATPARFDRWRPASPGDKWTGALHTCRAYESVTGADDGAFAVLGSWGRLSLGGVTGANGFFALHPARARELGLGPGDLLPLSPPGSAHLRSLVLDDAAVRRLGGQGRATLLFSPPGRPSAAARAYIRAGEADGVDRAYKCRVRTPWWRVPLPAKADVLVTYMNDESVCLCANLACVRHLNSVHGLRLADGARRLGAPVLALAAANSVTALGAELVGRSYGGGLLKLEPREAARLPVPSADLVARRARALRDFLPAARRLLTAGQRERVRNEVDRILGLEALIGADGVGQIRDARAHLVSRRRARAGRPRSGGDS